MGACPRSSEWCPQSIGSTVRFQSEQLSAFIGIRMMSDPARQIVDEKHEKPGTIFRAGRKFGVSISR
jgi:hypothetical protein